MSDFGGKPETIFELLALRVGHRDVGLGLWLLSADRVGVRVA